MFDNNWNNILIENVFPVCVSNEDVLKIVLETVFLFDEQGLKDTY
mgnify:CR=1 FL=1